MSEENSFLYAEYAKPITKKGKYGRLRLLLILSYVIVGAAYAAFFVSVHIPHFIAILPLLLWMLVYFTWGTVSFEIRVKTESGLLTIEKLCGKKAKVLYSVKIKELSTVEIYAPQRLTAIAPHLALDHRADPHSSASYLALHEKDGKKTVLLFEATDAVLKIIRYYNEEAIRLEKE